MENTLFYGDNLAILQKHVPDESVDLIYLDPPFNSNRDYNVLFREQSGTASPAQIKAFGDTWNWAGAAEAWADFADLCPNPKAIELMNGFHNTLGENDVMAYLVMMAPRLYHLHRVLKPTGSLYLHCDPTASAYLRLILDAIFGPKNFKNEIIWKRTSAHSSAKRWGNVHDSIFLYTRSDVYVWNQVYQAYEEAYLDVKYRNSDEKGRYSLSDLTAAGVRTGDSGQPWRDLDPTPLGRHWAVPREIVNNLVGSEKAAVMTTQSKLDLLDSNNFIYWTAKGRREGGGFPRYKRYLRDGVPIQDNITDISPINSQAAERLGYPTQKPLALLERIVNASSNPGDVVMDPFCGCGTAVVAAQKLGRKWVGIDITPVATSLIQKRLFDAFGAKDTRLKTADDPPAAPTFKVEGLPTDVEGARTMFEADHKKFEMWAVGLIPAIPQEKKGADGGIDGVAYFNVGGKNPAKAVVQVKGGGVGSPAVQQLRGAMHKENAELGFFLCLEKPTRAMEAEALAAGYYKPPIFGGKISIRALQIRTIGDLLNGAHFDFPLTGSNVSFAKADALAKEPGQETLEI